MVPPLAGGHWPAMDKLCGTVSVHRTSTVVAAFATAASLVLVTVR
jgi:hypothetical protein